MPLGLAAALFRDSWIDKTARVVALVGHSIPVFWFGIVGLVIFYAGLNWVGGPGRVDVYYEGIVTPRTGLMLVDSLLEGEPEIFLNALSHIILPAIILAYAAMAYITRMTRSFTLEQLNQDYVIAARAKGVGPANTVIGHVLPNIAVQLITVLAISYGSTGRRRRDRDRLLMAGDRSIHDECVDDRRYERHPRRNNHRWLHLHVPQLCSRHCLCAA